MYRISVLSHTKIWSCLLNHKVLRSEEYYRKYFERIFKLNSDHSQPKPYPWSRSIYHDSIDHFPSEMKTWGRRIAPERRSTIRVFKKRELLEQQFIEMQRSFAPDPGRVRSPGRIFSMPFQHQDDTLEGTRVPGEASATTQENHTSPILRAHFLDAIVCQEQNYKSMTSFSNFFEVARASGMDGRKPRRKLRASGGGSLEGGSEKFRRWQWKMGSGHISLHWHQPYSLRTARSRSPTAHSPLSTWNQWEDTVTAMRIKTCKHLYRRLRILR